jgi:hypothetical protein
VAGFGSHHIWNALVAAGQVDDRTNADLDAGACLYRLRREIEACEGSALSGATSRFL